MPQSLGTLIAVLPVTFLGASVILNVNLWSRFFMKIGVMAASIGLKKMDQSDSKRIKCIMTAVDATTIVLLGLTIGYTVFIIIDMRGDKSDQELQRQDDQINIVIGMFFALNGVLIFLTSQATVQRIRRYFKDFYFEHRCALHLTTLGLSLPLLAHSFSDISRTMRWYKTFLSENPSNIQLQNTLLFVFGDVVPIGFQFSSLIFGYIRNKNKKNKIGGSPSKQLSGEDVDNETNLDTSSLSCSDLYNSQSMSSGP